MEWIPLALALVAAVFFPQSEGCTCMEGGDLADYYCNDYTELILRGIVLNSTVVSNGRSDYPWDDTVSYGFGITDVIKAVGNSSRLVDGKSVVYINASTNEAMCGTSLTLGVEYVIVYCIPTGGNSLTCCRLERNGELSCLLYEYCVTDTVGETTRCCTISLEGTSECIDYPDLLLKK